MVRIGAERNTTDMSTEDLPLIAKSRLVKDFSDLGVRPCGAIMLHASVKAIGSIVGGVSLSLEQKLGLRPNRLPSQTLERP
jgi:hypothetical protein